MQTSRKWLLAVSAVLMLGATAMVVDMAYSPAAEAKENAPEGDHWRNHDGHWSFWHALDKCWYYTDGTHWFSNDGKGWKTYRFDREFGKTGFHKGDYKVPGAEVHVTVPHHKIYVHP